MIYLATDNGVIAARKNGDWQVLHRGLHGQRVTSIISREGVILAGTTDGIFRSGDEGRTWEEAARGLSLRHIRWLAYHPDISNFELAGTEPAGIFVSTDGASSWQEKPEVRLLRDKHQWYLPYSPEAGCVRGFALHGKRAYAAVEVGGVLVSDDQAESWHLAAGSSGNPGTGRHLEMFIHPDVHSIQVHPSSADLVFAPTGGGFYRSQDGGKAWELLYDCYCRAVWVDPEEANHILLGPADSVDRNGRIEETHDGGITWQTASAGLGVPWREHMVERFTQVGTELLAVLSNGKLLCTGLAELKWSEVLDGLGGINAVTGGS